MTAPTRINGRSTLATDPIRNFRFLVEFLPHDSTNAYLKNFKSYVGFTSVSGLSITTDAIAYREGGYNTSVHQIPGQSSFAPITMQRGVMLGTHQHWMWMKNLYQVMNATDKQGALNTNFRCDLDIRVLHHPAAGSASNGAGVANQASYDDLTAMRFRVYNAWPTALAFSDLNAGDSAPLVEQMTLVHEGWDVKWASGPGSDAAEF